MLVVIIFAAGLAVWDRREDAIARSRQETTTLGTVLAEQTARSIQAVDLVLQQTQAMLIAAGADTPERFREAAATQEVHSFLRDRWQALPQADAIALVGADGKLVNTSRNWPAQSIDLSDRDYVKWAQQDNDAPIFISVPAVSRSSGDWSFFLARRIDGASGELIGLVLSAIDIRYLEDFFRAISLHNDGSVAAFRRDGTMLARFPPVENMAGGKLPEQSG
ncbi:MAG: hybrid sensor histidine kinase/response regulator, partial [Alphaproteobacteria bacterium]|nr:hybrid sensor histidine kinase/response regulator [Alphaproteobacteria bacterium]